LANRFVDAGTGSDSDTGATFDLAWATLKHAIESGGLSAGDMIYGRPNHSEIPTADIVSNYSGSNAQPIRYISWPKGAFAITSASWTNGSTTVDLVLPATLTEAGHEGRYVTAPDGEQYFITRIIDSNTFIIDSEYAGATVTLTNGAASIIKDEHYDTAQAIDDSAWTIKKTDWDANNPAKALVDFNDTGYQVLIVNDTNNIFEGFEFKDSSDANGIVRVNYSTQVVSFVGCLFKQSASNSRILWFSECSIYMERNIIKGSGAGSGQVGLKVSASASVKMKNNAIYNCGDIGLDHHAMVFYENLNIGVEIANGDDDVWINHSANMSGTGLKLGGTNGSVYFASWNVGGWGYLGAENYQKILGDHRTFFAGGYYEKKVVSGETPNKKLSDDILKITPNISGYEFIPDWAFAVFIDKFKVSSGSKTIKYWIYNDSGVTLNDTTAKDNIWLELKYIKSYDDTSEYVYAEVFSSQIDILDAVDADAWGYLQGVINPALASEVRATIYFSKYLSSTNVIIDPERVIT